MTNDEKALLPCPFCGGEAERIDLQEAGNEGGSCISCKRCAACSPVHFDRKENLVSDWNRRAYKQAQADAPRERDDGVRKALEEAQRQLIAVEAKGRVIGGELYLPGFISHRWVEVMAQIDKALAASPQSPADSASAPHVAQSGGVLDAVTSALAAMDAREYPSIVKKLIAAKSALEAAPRAEDSASAEVVKWHRERAKEYAEAWKLSLSVGNRIIAESSSVLMGKHTDFADTIERLQAQLTSAVAAEDRAGKLTRMIAAILADVAVTEGAGSDRAKRYLALCKEQDDAESDTLKRLDAERAVLDAALYWHLYRTFDADKKLMAAVADLRRLPPASGDGEKEEGK